MVKRKKKPTMQIGTHGKYTTGSGMYQVHWGKPGYKGYNKRHKAFRKRTNAAKFVRSLKRKYGKTYKINYIYIAD